MSLMLNLKSVEDTELWNQIKNGFDKTPDKELADKISANLSKLCAEASSRMKPMPKLHPEFTLHDHTHLVRVTELMAKILGKSLRSLNPIEIMLLILSAHFHDQGMVLEDENLLKVRNSSEFKVHKELWIKEHPNFREIENHLASRDICEEERKCIAIKLAELEDAIIGDYVRKNHGKFSADYIKRLGENNESFEVSGGNIVGQLAKICESHVLPPDDITPENGFHHDELIGTHKVNIRFLALILRLADILDFDRDRTPDVLYRSIHFTNQVSIIEWEKLTKYLKHGLDPDEYWKLMKFYNGRLFNMRSRFIWEYLRIPFKNSQNRNVWKKFETLNRLFVESGVERFDLVGYDSIILSHTNEYKSWSVVDDENYDADGELKALIISMSSLNVEDGKIILEFVPPIYPDKAPIEFFIVDYFPPTTIYTLPYLDKLPIALTIQCQIRSANREHPLVQFALKNQFVDKQDNIQEFALDVVKCLSDESILDSLSSTEFRPTRYMKYIAHKYFEIDWEKYNCQLKPPYQIWLKNIGLIEIDESDFENWRRSK